MSTDKAQSAPTAGPTPGPWLYMPGVEGEAGFELSPGIRGADGFYVATVATDCPLSIAEANDKLLASAPTLAADNRALRDALAGLLLMIADGWIPPDDLTRTEAMAWDHACDQFRVSGAAAIARAALARTEGGRS